MVDTFCALGHKNKVDECYRQVQEAVAQGEAVWPWGYLLGNAASEGRLDICEFLLRHGMDGSAQLRWIAVYDQLGLPLQIELLRLFRHWGWTVANEDSEWGDTSVHEVAGNGNLAMLRFLVEKMGGASAFARPNDIGWTPLHAAVSGRHLECARYLLMQGADPNCMPDGEKPILSQAISTKDREMVQLLLSYGADPEQVGRMGWTPRLRARHAGVEWMLQ